jgi:class 3 adenylate cyclase
MSWQEDLSQKLATLSQAEFNYIETNDINKSSELDFNCSGLYMESTIIYFEIKNIEYLLKENGRRKIAQIYKMYHQVLCAVAEQNGGFVNCFSSDAFLVIFPGKEDTIPVAVKCAMKIASALSTTYVSSFGNIAGLEFGIGMDHGHIMGIKNLSDNKLEQINWLGACLYKAIRIGHESIRPYHISISSMLFHNLPENLRIKQRSILGIKKNTEIWTKVTYQHEGVKHHLYQTNQKLSIEEEP